MSSLNRKGNKVQHVYGGMRQWETEETEQFVTSADDPEIKKIVSMVTTETNV